MRNVIGRDAAAVAAVAVASYALQSVAWPLAAGRDVSNYLIFYAELWSADPVLPAIAGGHTPLGPLIFGLSLDYLGAAGAEVVAGVLFVATILLVRVAGAVVDRRVGIVTAVVVALFPPFGSLFHEVSTDAPFAFAFAALMAAIAGVVASPTHGRLAAFGAAAALTVLARPSGQVLVPLAVLTPFLLPLPLRRRLAGAATVALAAGLPLLGWAAVNAVRIDQLAVARSGRGSVPLIRVLTIDRSVDPANGEATRRLVRAMEERLLPLEPYRSFRVSASEALREGGFRVYGDLTVMSDRTWGWGDHSLLSEVGIEAVRAQPGRFARSVSTDLRGQLTGRYRRAASDEPEGRGHDDPLVLELPARRVDGRLVPILTEGEPIPASNLHVFLSRPDNAIRYDWSDLARPRLVFADPVLERRYVELFRRRTELLDLIPNRDGSRTAADALNGLALRSPLPILWLAVGLAGLLIGRRRRSWLVAGVPLGMAFAVLLLTTIAQPPFREYRLVFDPAFILFGVAGLHAVAARLTREAPA